MAEVIVRFQKVPVKPLEVKPNQKEWRIIVKIKKMEKTVEVLSMQNFEIFYLYFCVF